MIRRMEFRPASPSDHQTRNDQEPQVRQRSPSRSLGVCLHDASYAGRHSIRRSWAAPQKKPYVEPVLHRLLTRGNSIERSGDAKWSLGDGGLAVEDDADRVAPGNSRSPLSP